MKKTPHAHLNSLKIRLRELAKKGDLKQLDQFLASAAFDQYWCGTAGDLRRRAAALKLVNAAREACLPAAPLKTGLSNKTPKWNPERIAALRAAWARYGTDEGVARALDMPLAAARRARYRYVRRVDVATQGVAEAA